MVRALYATNVPCVMDLCPPARSKSRESGLSIRFIWVPESRFAIYTAPGSQGASQPRRRRTDLSARTHKTAVVLWVPWRSKRRTLA